MASSEPERGRIAPLLLAMGGFEDGFALLLVSGALLTMVGSLGLRPAEVGLVVSAPFLGSVIGALGFGRLGDLVGRRRSYMLVLALLIIGSGLSALAPSFGELLVGRLLVGLGIGGDIPTGGALLAEIADRMNRGRFLAAQSFLWGVGGASAAALAVPLLSLGPDSWRYILALGMAPPMAILALRGMIPESRRWIGARGNGRGDGDRAAVAARRYAGRLALVAGSALAVTAVLAVFANYLPTMLRSAEGLSAPMALLVGALQWVGFIVGSGLAMGHADRMGRRPLLSASALIAAASLAMGYAAFGAGIAWVAASIVAMWVAGGAAFSCVQIYSNELFPTRLRSTSSGLSFAAGRLGGYVSTLVLPSLIAISGLHGLLMFTAPPMAAVALAAALAAPSSEGRELEELEAELVAPSGPAPARRK